MKKSVLVDIDDTLADTQVKLLEYANSKSVRQYAYHEMSQKFREKQVPEWAGLVKDFLQQPDLVETVQPYSDAFSAMKKLHEAGYLIHIASSRKENLHSASVNWLKQHGLIDFVTEIHGRMDNNRGSEFKVASANKSGAIAAFDDTLGVVTALAGAVETVYLIDKPWNQTQKLPVNVVRTSSFADAVDLFLGARSG